MRSSEDPFKVFRVLRATLLKLMEDAASIVVNNDYKQIGPCFRIWRQ